VWRQLERHIPVPHTKIPEESFPPAHRPPNSRAKSGCPPILRPRATVIDSIARAFKDLSGFSLRESGCVIANAMRLEDASDLAYHRDSSGSTRIQLPYD